MGQMNETPIKIGDLSPVETISDTSSFIVDDGLNTQSITLLQLRRNLINDTDGVSTDKVYSSEKVDSLIKENNEGNNATIRELTSKIEAVDVASAKKEEVDLEISTIKETMFTQEDKENMETALATKRDKTVPIKAADLDASTDEGKIHLKNLSEEVLSAMTGSTPVALVKSPVGGWTEESIANKAVSSRKLSASYRYKGHVTNGSMDDILEEGIYLVSAGVTGCPKWYDGDTETKRLTVTSYGESREFIEQRVEYMYQNELRPAFVRKGKLYNLHNLEFYKEYVINSEFKVSSELIGEDISNRGVITTGDVLNLTAEGTYKVLKGVENLPTADGNYFVTVHKHGDEFVYEAKLDSDTIGVIYLAYKHENSAGISITTQWFKITNNNKSKFDDVRLHIFGDGVAYGLGSSDIETSFPSIMTKNYGFKVFNHAITDATAGNYGSAARKERSVITQVESTSFHEGDIAVILVGTNDFKYGSCPIGNDTDSKDTTFKGSLNIALSKIYGAEPSTRVVLATPIFRGVLEPGDERDSDVSTVNGRKLADYANAVLDIARVNHLPSIDLLGTLGINSFNKKYYLSDGVYLNDKGHILIAQRIFNVLSGLF